jgi:antirestriction protein ArdC
MDIYKKVTERIIAELESGACGMTQRGYITADHCVYCGAETEESTE